MQQLGKYNVIRRLGVGGMAEVFLCKLVGIGGFEKHVVLKKIRADIASDDEFITMFFDEARLAANLTHPNIIQVFEVDQLEGMPYIAMEYVRGATLAAVLKKLRAGQTQMELGHIAYVFAGVCAGLEYAHSARDASGRALNIVHRDISPQNIIVSLDGTPKIFDFGVAKAAGSLALTGADRVKGKFAYMAPEQLRGKPVDAKADVYAVGVCLYEAVTGRRPFTGGTEAELYAARLEGQFRMPSELVPSIPVELEHLILSAMASDPADRPTALELQEALSAFCAVGSMYPSGALSVAAWLKQLIGEEQPEAYVGYSAVSPSMTPMPRSANLAPTTPAVEAHHRRAASLNKMIAILGSAAVVLAGVLVTILLRNTSEEPARVASTQPAQHEPIAPPPAPPTTAPAPAAATAAPAPVQTPAVARPVAAEPPVVREMTVAKPDAADEPDEHRVDRAAKKKALAPVRVAVASKPAAAAPRLGAGSGAGSGSGSGMGSAASKVGLGSGSAVPAGSGAGSAHGGAGSAQQVAVQVAPAASTPVGAGSATAMAPAKAAPAKITAPAAPTAPAIASPGSLDAMPSLTKLSVDGSLTTTEVHNALTRTLETLRSCYRSAAKVANQTPDVSIKVSFEIDEGARASGVRISGDSFGLGACAKNAIGDVRTRVAPDVGTVSVSAVVRFKPTR